MSTQPVGGPPVWLLDVDGVLNARHPAWGDAPRQGWARAMGGHFRITWSPELAARLRALHAAGSVDVRWATTWAAWIGEIESLLGLPTWPVALDQPPGSPAIGAPGLKLAAALRVVEHERRPLVWTDDDAIPRGGDPLRRLLAGPAPALLIRPDPATGLRPGDLDAIEAFLGRGR